MEKSISAEETFDTDIVEKRLLDTKLLELCERTTVRLRKKSLVAKTVQVKIRAADFSTFTRQMQLTPPSNNTDQVFNAAKVMLARWLSEQPGTAIRLLGVGGSDLVSARQGDLFGGSTEDAPSGVDRAVDGIRDRFGRTAVGRARSLDPD